MDTCCLLYRYLQGFELSTLYLGLYGIRFYELQHMAFLYNVFPLPDRLAMKFYASLKVKIRQESSFKPVIFCSIAPVCCFHNIDVHSCSIAPRKQSILSFLWTMGSNPTPTLLLLLLVIYMDTVASNQTSWAELKFLRYSAGRGGPCSSEGTRTGAADER